MQVKTDELIGNALDWAVAQCEGHQSRCSLILEKEGWVAWQSYEEAWGNPIPEYSIDRAQGGLIIERERISTSYDSAWVYDPQDPDDNGKRWYAENPNDLYRCHGMYGPTPLIAAMRCFVASKLGDTVEIPNELIKVQND